MSKVQNILRKIDPFSEPELPENKKKARGGLLMLTVFPVLFGKTTHLTSNRCIFGLSLRVNIKHE